MNLKAYKIPERYKRGTAKGTSGSSSSSSFYERLAEAKYQRELKKAYQDYSKMYNEQEALYQAEQEAQKELTQDQIEREQEIQNTGFLGRTGQTLLDLTGNLIYGAARTVEGVVDLSIAVFGEDTEENRQRIIKDWSQENIKSKYDEKTKASFIDSNTEFGQFVEGVAQGLGQLGVQAGVSLIPGVGQAASLGSIALSGSGSGVEGAYKEGATKRQALTYGSIMGATEVLSEKLLNIGPMQKVFGKGFLNDFASKFTKTTFGKIATQFAGEGLEEVFSDFVNPIAKYITYQSSQGKDFEAWSGKDLLNSFIIGGTVASIAGGGSTIVGSTKYGSIKIYNDMDNITNLTNKMYDTLQRQEGVVSTEEIDKFNSDMAQLYAQLESDLNAYGAKVNLSESQNEKRLSKQREKLDKLNKQLEKRTSVKDTFSIEEGTNKLVGNENIAMNFDPRLEGFVNADRNYRSKGKIEGEDVTLGNITLQSSKKLDKEQMKKVQKAAKVLNAFNNANLFEGQQRKVVFSDSKDIFNESKDTIENGYYDPNNNTIYINLNSEKPLDFVLGHEFAHSVENMDLHEIAKKEEPLEVRKKKNKLRNSSSDLRNFVTNLIKTDKYFRDYFNTYTQEHADRKKLYADYLKNRSKKVIDRYIDEEIVADFVGKYLTNDRFLNKLKGQKRSLIQKFADYFKNLQQTKGLSKEEKQYIKEVEEKFTNLLESPLPYEVISETKDGTPIAIRDKGQIRYNIVTYLNGGRAMIEDELLRKKHKRSEIDKFLIEMDEMVRFTKELMDKYPIIANSQNLELNTDNEGHVIASAWVKNGDYKFNIDLTTICKKREPFTKTLDYILKEVDLNTVELTPAKIAELNKLLQKKGVETACPLCFVDAKRYNLSNWASKVRNDWNRLARYDDQQLKDYIAKEDNDIKEGKKEKVSKLYKVAKDMLKNPSIKKELTLEQIMSSDFMTNAERDGNKTLVYWAKNAYGQATPKPIKEYQPYNNEILDRKKTSKNVKSASDKVGGVRLFSFSDFKIEDFFDYVQMFSNLAAKKLKLQAYVKEISFIEIFGMTGAKINASLVPKVQIIYKDGKIDVKSTKDNAGLDEKGNFIYDEKHSIDDKLIFDLIKKDGYRGNIGTILVGISDKHIRKALNDDRISMVIPYHKSSINAIVAEMFQINYYKDYTEFQTTKNPNPEYKYNKKGKKVEVKFKDFDFYGDLNKTNDPRTTANNYLKWCDEKGYIPKFPQFRDEKNYYKLLIDFNVYDGDTYAPQQDVQMKFPENFQQIVEKYVSERQDQVNRQNKIVDEIKDDAVGILTKKSISKKPQLEVKRSISKKTKPEVSEEVREKVNANKNKTKEKTSKFVDTTIKATENENIEVRERNKGKNDKNREPEYNQEFIDRLKTDGALVYEVTDNNKIVEQAKAELKNIHLKDSDAQVERLLSKINSNKRLKPLDVAKTILLAQKCAEIGKNSQATDLVYSLSAALTEYGQTIQIASIVKRLTPEGKLKTWEKVIDRMNRNVKTEKISKSQKRMIKERMEKYFDMDVRTMKEAEITRLLVENDYKGVNSEKIVNDIKKVNETDETKFKEKVNEVLNKYISDEGFRQKLVDEYTKAYFENLDRLTKMYESPLVLIPEALVKELTYNKYGEEAEIEIQKKIQKALNEQKQVGFWDKIDSYRMLAMLFNPKTHSRNIGSNFVMGQISKISSNYVQNFVEWGAAKLGILNENERTTTFKKVDTRDYIYAQKLGSGVFDEIKFETSKYQQIPEGTTVFENKLLEKARIMNNNLLENVEDKSAFIKTFANRFSKWMTANNYTEEFLNNPDNLEIKQKGIEIAQQEALEATFKDFSVLVQSINKLKANSKVARFLISAIMPFTKTPINIARRGIQYSPVGLASSISNVKKVKNGEISVNEWISNMSKGLTGSMITMLGIFLAKLGLVTGGGSGSDKEDKYLEYQGQKSFSLVIGDKSYTLDWLAPASIPFFTGVELYNTIENKINKKNKGEDDTDGSSLGAYFDVMFKTLDPLTEMSFIKSINDALSSYEDNKMGGALKSAYQNYLTSFQPTVLAQAAKVIEKSRRSLTGTKDSEYFGNYLISRIPFYSTALEPYIDVWGNEDSEASLITKFNENLVYPWWIYEKKEETSKVDDEIMRLYKMTGNTKILPSIPKYYYTKDGVKYEMTNEEYTEYRINYGQFNYKALNSLFSSSYYKNLSDEEKESAIESIYSLGTNYAKKTKIYYVANALGEKNAPRIATYLANISNITSLRDKNGKVISGSKKALTFEYINSIKSLSKVQKQLLYSYAGYYNPSYYSSIKKYLKEQGYTTQEILMLLNEFNIKEVE